MDSTLTDIHGVSKHSARFQLTQLYNTKTCMHAFPNLYPSPKSLMILLPNIQRHQKPTYTIIRRNSRRNLHNFLITKTLLQLSKHLIRHRNSPSHSIRIPDNSPLFPTQRPLRQIASKISLGISNNVQRLVAEAALREKRCVLFPFEERAIDHCHAADCKLPDHGGKTGLGADCPDEGVPAVCDGEGVEEGQVEGEEGVWRTAGLHVGEDSGFLWCACWWRVWYVWETHCESMLWFGD